MVNKFFGMLVLLALQQNLLAQSPATDYAELPNPKPTNQASWNAVKDAKLHAAFGSSNLRYEKGKAPSEQLSTQWSVNAWRNERVHTQFLLWSATAQPPLSIKVDALTSNKGDKIPATAITTGFIRYVLTDSLNKKGEGCGYRKPGEYDSSLVADGIDIINKRALAAATTQPVWLSIQVPASTPAGIYKGKITVIGTKEPISLPYEIVVSEHLLPAPKDWQFHLDLWQSPDAIARIHRVKPWSDEHFKAMKPYMQMLANAGQKVITTAIIYDPWNAQTKDIYSSTVKWTKKKDGSWKYDYTIFDKWVQFMIDLGIKKEINCYSMIPWNLKFHYYDEALAKDTFIVAKPGTKEYTSHWEPMLKDFAAHLKAKGWFKIATIAMDERPMDAMQEAIKVARSADKDFRLSLAGSYHAPLAYELYDYCIASAETFPTDVLRNRIEKGLPTTFYTCCAEDYPNTFTFSPPGESAFMGWYAANKGFNGYLRWAYNSWNTDPLRDSRFGNWAAGDTYFVYPGARSSMRFEKMVEGIQAYEKIRILKDLSKGNPTALAKIDKILKLFEIKDLKSKAAADLLAKANKELSEL
ncbi:DUF4091 domain-containing protein [Chitinophaga silvatica]|uniref:DUF4091 domain-containing protein n=1 Tax=Chitinophaga silvatica TaxID=2282649 RepID=A0A3E1YDB4_9BACT|nr:DUF4091 domain-containing protein [Chitinophaga silvatica]RFS24536.1 DUF4091 domain-containing protein [Chitinophaga silvatica]